MKCLFFLYGEYRTFQTAVKTWNILDIPDLDIVIHTPTTSSHHIKSENFKNITEHDFSILKNKKIFFYQREDYRKTDLHVLHFSYRFLSKYLNENYKDKYDYIFIGRLDSTFYLEDYKKLLSEKREELFILHFVKNHLFIPDHSFFGSYSIIKKFVDNLPPTEKLVNSHSDMANYVFNNFKISQWDYSWDSYHIRDNMISYFESYFNQNGKIKNIDNLYIDFMKKFHKTHFIHLDNEYKKLNK